MLLNKSDLPYLHEYAAQRITLPNGIQQQIAWEYSLTPALVRLTMVDPEVPIVLERLRRKQCYMAEDYLIIAATVDEWQYLDHPQLSYAACMLGYRSYWDGQLLRGEEPTLQPEVAVILGLTNNLEQTPAYIETISKDELLALLEEAQAQFKNDDAIAFSYPLPIEAPPNAPPIMRDVMRRMRAQTRLLTTRGRAAILEWLMKRAGVAIDNGGWYVLPQEIERRQKLGLR